MKANLWAKTSLSVYRYLERIADAIDRLVESKAINSFYVNSSNFFTNGVSVVADKIIELSERKVKLINFKVLIEKALTSCDAEQASLLIEKYFDGEKVKDIVAKHGLSMRTYFRKLNAAENAFYCELVHVGFTDEKLNQYLSSEKWIMEVMRRYAQDEKDVEVHALDMRKLEAVS